MPNNLLKMSLKSIYINSQRSYKPEHLTACKVDNVISAKLVYVYIDHKLSTPDND